MAKETGDLTPEGEEIIAETPERPEWLPEQYADEQAFLTSHKEAQRKITEQGHELSRMREEMQDLSALVQEQPQQHFGSTDPAQNPFVLAYQRAVDDGDVAAQLAIQAQLMDTVVQQRLEAQGKQASSDERGLDPYLIAQMHDSISARFGADEALKSKAVEIMESHPVISARLKELDGDSRSTIGDLAPVVETAYELARAGSVHAEQASLAQKQAEQETARQRKIDAETLPASGQNRVASESEQEAAWARIKGADLGGLRIGSQ